MTMQNYVTLKPKDGSGPSNGAGWKVAFTTNAMVEYETATGGDFFAVNEHFEKAEAGRINIGVMRRILWAGLIAHQEGFTERDAGEVLDACGFKETFAAVGGAMRLAFPEQKDAGAGKPQAAKATAPTKAELAQPAPASTGPS
ncbi:hypothetical protein [Pseudooceanicola spongiae]|uniref:Uncharacterized protein n=1 Tax=Pseudooceanicola spongiae TaxID=2613965 RepID=A0A7L9WJY1_9RHOB|nr:hypothetical protein [Pseudooceanicola spongiae]QOL80539.1 hypothetical protein F3W81_06775 [Pseudooceanicola spongiae]